ncbi:MAG: VCBS repeat-containing protein [Elusimicrobia bacterium]|nr:VCBS repeat-containing protein [Elusimicrobiota bacterium]
MRRSFLGLAAVVLAAPAFGQNGYVVRASSGLVYLDLLAGDGAAVGRRFIVYTEGEELKHPATGKSLGRIEQKVADGQLREVTPQYSVGALADPAAPVSAGQRARLEGPAPAAAPPALQAAAPPVPAAGPGSRKPAWKSPNARLETVDLDIGDVDGNGTKEFVLAEGDRVLAYPAESAGKQWEPSCAYKDKNTGTKYLSLEAFDLNGDGRAEVFATYHNEFFSRVETAVLDCKAGTFEAVVTLPWMVRSVFEGSGRRTLAAQSLLSDRTFPFGGIFPLIYAEGKYQLGTPAIHAKRVEWIYSFARTADEQGDAPLSVFYEPTGRLRAQFRKDYWKSPDTMGQTSNRVRWHDRLLRFTPRLPVVGSEGTLAAVYAVRNIPRLGNLADAFGIYGRGEVQRLRWTGTGLETDWTAEADGYVAGVTIDDAIYVAVVGSNGATSVWKYVP